MMQRESLIRKAVYLSWFTIIYNLVEGVVSIFYGVSDESFALAGFGGDSLIEVGSAFLVLWRFRGESAGGEKSISLEREKRATLGIGILFILLALTTGTASSVQLIQQDHPETTLPGLIISALSLSFMFYLWSAKRDVGRKLDSSTVLADAACSLACIKLSAVLFVGSLFFIVLPSLWWVDSAAALIIALLIGQEGREMIRAAQSPEFTGGCCAHD